MKRSRSESTADKWAREAEGKKRESKKRIVMMEGGEGVGMVPVSVSRYCDNLTDCLCCVLADQFGQYSIRDVEKAERDEAGGNRELVKRQRAWVHDTECFQCKKGVRSVEKVTSRKNKNTIV